MSPELRRNNWEGAVYSNEELGIPEIGFSLYTHFCEPRRVKMEWEGRHDNGKEGWMFGTDICNEVAYELIKWDSGEISAMNAQFIRFI